MSSVIIAQHFVFLSWCASVSYVSCHKMFSVFFCEKKAREGHSNQVLSDSFKRQGKAQLFTSFTFFSILFFSKAGNMKPNSLYRVFFKYSVSKRKTAGNQVLERLISKNTPADLSRKGAKTYCSQYFIFLSGPQTNCLVFLESLGDVLDV